MLIIGLTGGIGSGKSTALTYFSDLGVPVLDADDIAHALTAPGQATLDDIAAAFGPGILDRHGHLDRAQLRTLVFADPARRRQLETILHPKIRAEMKRRLATLAGPYCVLCIPLLMETGQADLVHRVLVVDAPPELQRQRAQSRSQLSGQEVQAIMDAQLGREARLAQADDVISNDGDRQALRLQVEQLHQRYLALATNYPTLKSDPIQGPK